MAGSGGWPIQHPEIHPEFSDYEGDGNFGVNYDFNINELSGLDGKVVAIFITLF